ncbi:hypothetical protein QC764_113598 [Podospora pseudoanserina]|uniref:Metallo-beta-lactamase domain-containing protein n=1 Tax=Podospora pseudoanserina TaxID=2609844 RepID=A0ABR0IP00_9PEZI|nr:hypothetical protein QC764_113598 [Podospora pseudoanserina]
MDENSPVKVELVGVYFAPPCILSLLELPEPDLVIISHHSSKHCNKATLQQLPAVGTKTVMLTTPASGSKIKSWKYFEKSRVKTLPKWKPQEPGRLHILRFPTPSTPPGEPGEITVAFLPQKHDILGLQYAIGITYRPPPAPLYHLPLPQRLRSKSQTSLRTPLSPVSVQQQPQQHPLPPPDDRPISILYIPHGIPYPTIHTYITNHLISEAALPLTVLLHPFNNTHHRGTVPSGIEIAIKIAAKVWIGAHDGDLVLRGLINRLLFSRRRKIPKQYTKDDIHQLLATKEEENATTTNKTAVLVLEPGEKTTLHSTTSKPGGGVVMGAITDRGELQDEQQGGHDHGDAESTKGQDDNNNNNNNNNNKTAKDNVGSASSGKTPATAAAGISIPSLEKCNWRSNLELFLKKEEVHHEGGC